MRCLFSLGVLALFAAPAVAQDNLPSLPQPRLQSIFPCGAKLGATVEVTFAGTDLELPEALHFSHPGLTAEEEKGSGSFVAALDAHRYPSGAGRDGRREMNPDPFVSPACSAVSGVAVAQGLAVGACRIDFR